MYPGRFTREIKGIINDIPPAKFVFWSEVTVIIFLAFFILFTAPVHPLFYRLLIVLLVFFIVISCLMVSSYCSSLDSMGLLSGLLLLSGITVALLQVEHLVDLGELELTVVFYVISAALAAGFGAYLIYKKVGRISRGLLFMTMWIFSLVLILYYPTSRLLTVAVGWGRGEFTSLALGGIISILSSSLFIYNSRMQEEYSILVDVGDMRRALGDSKGAEIAYLSALETGVNYYGIQTRLGDLMLDENRHGEAMVYYNNSLGYLEDRNYRQAALAAWCMGQYKQAKEYMIKGLNQRASPQSWYFLGKICGNMDEKDREREGYRLSLEMDKDYWPSLAGLAGLLEGEDSMALYKRALIVPKYHQSKRKLLRKVKTTGKFAPVYLHPGDLALMEKEHGEIDREDLLPLIEHIIDTLDIHDARILGEIYIALDDFYDLETGSFLEDFDDPEVILVRSLIRASLGEDIDREELENITEPGVRRDESLYILGIQAMLKGENENAMGYLDSIRTSKVKPLALAAKGGMLYSEGRLHEARIALRTAVALGYDDTCVWEGLKQLSEELGEWEQSIYHARRTIEFPTSLFYNGRNNMVEIVRLASHGELDVDNIDTRITNMHPRFAGTLRFLRGEYSAADDIFKSILKEKPDHAEGHLGRGISLLGMLRYREALEELDTAVAIDGEDPLYLFYYGYALFKTGNIEDAYRAFDSVYFERPMWESNNYYRYLCEKEG